MKKKAAQRLATVLLVFMTLLVFSLVFLANSLPASPDEMLSSAAPLRMLF